VCTCPYGENSKRKKIKAIIHDIAGNDDSIRYTMFKAMNNVNINYLIPDSIRERLPDMGKEPNDPDW
jgi:hypothetical protein